MNFATLTFRPARRSFGLLVTGFVLTITSTAHADDIADLKADVSALESLTQSQAQQITTLKAALSMALTKTQFVTVGGKSMYIRGCNVMIQNSNSTATGPNGLGNLILGFNPLRGDGSDERTGSHFLIMGGRNNYAGNGGIVGGDYNACSGGSAILTGNNNIADGYQSVILTGGLNRAHGTYGLVGTGVRNAVQAPAEGGAILGGTDNGVWGFFGTVIGGQKCGTEGKYAAVMTGIGNVAASQYTAIVTGEKNYTGGQKTNAILTGYNNYFKISPTGCTWLTGENCGADWDNSDPNNWKPWMYRAMTEHYLVHY